MIPQGMWTYRKVNRERADALAEALQVSPITAGLLTLRGIESPREAQRFLSPSLEDLVDPFSFTGMKKAVDRILLADDEPRSDVDTQTAGHEADGKEGEKDHDQSSRESL